MRVIHGRKTMAGTKTWCGARREYPPEETENSSPFSDDVTCEKCKKAAAEWLRKYQNQARLEKAERERPKMSYQSERLFHERKQAEEKAIDSLARYKFQMFGYWAGIWVHLNKISEDPQPNPFGKLVKLAKEMRYENT
jgi:hypothetical protein